MYAIIGYGPITITVATPDLKDKDKTVTYDTKQVGQANSLLLDISKYK